MKILYTICFSFLLAGCEPAGDCLKTSGALTTVNLAVEPFSALEIIAEFNVILQEGPEQQLSLTTGKNLVDDINFEVINEIFIIRNGNSCRWARSYDFPTLTITHPNIRQIRQGGSGLIVSEGVLNYPNLLLVSDDQSGDFKLEVNSNLLTISSNDVSNFYLSGQCDNLNLSFHSGDGRFEGENLTVANAVVSHCGSNDMVIHATKELKGRLCASGNVIFVKTVPELVDVTIMSNGHLINRTE